jgi:hypothetical protein
MHHFFNCIFLNKDRIRHQQDLEVLNLSDLKALICLILECLNLVKVFVAFFIFNLKIIIYAFYLNSS